MKTPLDSQSKIVSPFEPKKVAEIYGSRTRFINKGKRHYKLLWGRPFHLFNSDRQRRCCICKSNINLRDSKSIFCETCSGKFPHGDKPNKPKQAAAHRIVSTAVKAGIISPIDSQTKCVDCGSVAKVYEHRDYNKPLDVVPVCHSCNAKRGSAENAA